MLSTALRTLRTRWVTFVGSFVALSLGVALIAVMGLALASSLDAPDRRPERFAAAPVVVKGVNTLRVPTPIGDRKQKLARPNAVPAPVVEKLRRLGKVVEDRSYAVRARGGPDDLVGHPWSTAAFARYELVDGRAPKAADEVVVSGDWAVPGERVRTDLGTVRVVGTVGSLGFEDAVFHTDARAAELAPHSVQLVVEASADAVRKAVDAGSGVSVLTGDRRRLADADPDRDSEAITAMNAMFGTAGGVTGFVSVFVVASTFAFAVAQRKREFGLLRTAGATPGQIRRMVFAEAVVVGVLASAAGCVLGAYGAPWLAEWVVEGGLAPSWFTIGDHTWPYHMAFWTGLFVALCGVVAASWRAGKTGPTEALREASVDTRTMTWGRWLFGAGLLVTAVVTLALALFGDPGDLLHRKTYTSRPMLLITAVALLAPVLVGPLTRLIAWLPAQLPGASGMLVRENAAAGIRRTAAIAAPVLVTVALAGSLLGATATLNEAKATETRDQTAAAFVLSPAGDAGFDAAAVERMREVPGAEVSATSTSAVYVLEEGVALIRSDARAADPALLADTVRMPVTAGKVSDLDDDSIIVNEEWEKHSVGQRVDVWLGDGTRKSLKIAAVMAIGTGNNGVYVTPANAAGAPVDRVDVALADGADRSAVAAGLRKAMGSSGGEVFTKEQWVRATYPETNRTTRIGFLLVLGIALLYTGISLANTMVMATSDRIRDLAVLRLAGATRWQVLRVVGAEALMVVAVGGILGLLVAGLNLLGMWGALGILSVWTPIAIPWATLGAVVGACAVLAVVSAVVPAGLSLRRRAVELAGVHE
ncbi:putative ABC transport system permease protein [Streptomyces umbrinus]|uniref:ABC transport system permease protein n=1 Tax=Streptomyces umbrinus TaxID=67370 RepID=A0ABU0STW1_9ACTN|nr:FtsX-like permease family protein [Streptomyces umbrinus]MDQ1026931.1 putative ABC transport system permease protein [Streptomyces umbrinus]